MDEVEDLVNTEDKTSFENMTGSVCGKRFPKSKVHMELEKKRYINITWLPGQEEWYGNSHKVFQISEEDFNKVVEKYNEMVKVAKEIKAT